MQALRQDMLTFVGELSGIPVPTEQEQQDENYQKGLWTSVGGEWLPRTDWRLYMESYRTGRFNEWVYAVVESAIQLLKELNQENVDLIYGRYATLKKYYYEMKNQPKALYGGVATTYERAFNKYYYSK